MGYSDGANVYLDRSPLEVNSLVAKAATGVGAALKVGEYRDCVASIKTTGFTGTIKFSGSAKQAEPDWTLASSDANRRFTYVQSVNMENGTAVDGNTGISYTTDTNYYEYEINTNLVNWVNVEVTARSAGSVSVTFRPSKNFK